MMFKTYVKLYTKIFPKLVLEKKLEELLQDCKTVLDLGCGKSSVIQKFKNISYSVGVDVFELYLREAQEKGTHNEYVMADINQIEFKQKSFDAVVAIDVLEHLTKKEGHALIERMENWAKKKVIIFTPNNYVEQEEYEKDIFQEHKSGWSYEELKELGFEVVGMGDWRKVREAHAIPKYKPRVL